MMDLEGQNEMLRQLESAWAEAGVDEEVQKEKMKLISKRIVSMLRRELNSFSVISNPEEEEEEDAPPSDAAGDNEAAPAPEETTPPGNRLPGTRSLPTSLPGSPPLTPRDTNVEANICSTPKTSSKRPPLAGESPAMDGKRRKLVPSHTPRSKYVATGADTSKYNDLQWFYKGAPSPNPKARA
mmetsp:Transcript_51657/g.165171  ORF Transcript_51657/g.165171 Transcript_51657/m.165171 type:complete len:183 (-) Transcript_51657:139-687(-)